MLGAATSNLGVTGGGSGGTEDSRRTEMSDAERASLLALYNPYQLAAAAAAASTHIAEIQQRALESNSRLETHVCTDVPFFKSIAWSNYAVFDYLIVNMNYVEGE